LIVTGNSYAEEKLVVIEKEAKEDNRQQKAENKGAGGLAIQGDRKAAL
jgi:hypothetical protein